ncbi:hypothetical protein EDD11_001469 [Mortierella claussenii]|nr:hypothetical protein EDD11_001469 [Mortierella claussenii]
MPPPKRYVQQIRLGDNVQRVLAKEKNGQIYVLLDDVRDVFENAKRLVYNDGLGVPFMTDEDDNRIKPLRIEYHEDDILDVVVGPATEDRPTTGPITIPSPQSTAPTTPVSSFTGSMASPRSLSPVSVAPLSIARSSLVGALCAVNDVAGEAANGESANTTRPQAASPEVEARASSTLSTHPSTYVVQDDKSPLQPPWPLDPALGVETGRKASSPQLRESDQYPHGAQPQNESQSLQDVSVSGPLRQSIHTVHTMPMHLPIDLTLENDRSAQDFALHPFQYEYAQQQYQEQKQQEQQQQRQSQDDLTSQPLMLQSSTYSGEINYQPRSTFSSRPLPPVPGQDGESYLTPLQQQQQYQHQHHQYQQQLSSYQIQYQLPFGQQYPPASSSESPPIPPRPQNVPSPATPVHPFHRLSIAHAPQALDPEGRAVLASSPTATSFTAIQHSLEQFPHQQSPPNQRDQFSIASRVLMEEQPGKGQCSDNYSPQHENETKVKDLEMKLRRAQDQTLAYAKKNHALARQSAQMSIKIMNRATLIQNKVQAVLTQNHELHEHPVPRLFIVLPVLILNPTQAPTAVNSKPVVPSNDQRKFRVHFLCECGQFTRPLQSSGLNHIHSVEHEGYEIERPLEFFEKYGAFIRSLSHLIRRGVNCGSVSIPPLLAAPQQHQQYQQHQNDPNSIYRAYTVGQETLKNQILDTRLAEAIEYLDSLDMQDDDDNQDPVGYFDGTNLRQLQAYIRIPPQEVDALANLYKIVTNRGYVKWICEDHYRSTIHYLDELAFQKELVGLGGHYNLRTGQAKIQLATAQDASHLYKIMTKAHNLHELDIGLKWQFTDGDLQKLVYAINESKVRALTLDGGRQKQDTSSTSSMKLINFGKKYDPLLRVIFCSRMGSLKLTNMPSLMNKISTKQHQIQLTASCGIKALHLENVGVLDFSGADGKSGNTLSMNLGLNSGNSKNSGLSFLRILLATYQTLSEIILPGMNIRDEGVTVITEQISLQKTLRRVDLHNNAISSVGGRLLAAFLSREKALTYLDLGLNAIGDEALVQVIDALGPSLVILNLESTGFREAAAKALERMIEAYNSPSTLEPQLEYLNLANNAWTTSSIQTLGRIIMRLRLEIPPPSSPSITAPMPRKHDKPTHLEMGPAESFLVINSMIKTNQLVLPTDRPWYQQPDVLTGHYALTATKESYTLPAMRAQDSIAVNSKLKALRLQDAGLSESAARYLIGLLDVSVMSKIDLRRCVRLFKPREILTILGRIFPNSMYLQEGDSFQMHQRQSAPQAPAPVGVIGSPQNCLRFIHLNQTGVDDHVARILAQDLQSGFCRIERLDIGSNHLTHQGIAMILNALCHNTSLQHLNLGQNFSALNAVYPSAASAQAQGTREAFQRFMEENKTLQILYFVCVDIEAVARGLSSNSTIRSLVFDRLEGTLGDVQAFGRALAKNETLMRFKVYDNRQDPFLQAYYGSSHPQQKQQQQSYFHQQTSHHLIMQQYQKQQQQQQQLQYVDPFKDFKQEAIKTIEKGITFNQTLIEFQWPEMFDRTQPWTERLEGMLTRNITLLKSNLGSTSDLSNDSSSRERHFSSYGENKIHRGLSVLSTSSTLSNNSDTSSTSSLSSLSSSNAHYTKDMQGLKRSQTSHSGFAPSMSPTSEGPGGPGNSYAYSIHSNSSNSIHHGNNGAGQGGSSSAKINGGGNGNDSTVWDDRKLSVLELSPWTLNRLRNAPTREQQQQLAQQQVQQQQRPNRMEAETHIMQRFKK